MVTEYPDFNGFDWDAGNRDKNLKHGVHGWECEQVFFNEPLVILEDAKHSVAEDRFAAFGQTDAGRELIVVYTMRKKRLRVISARDMNKRERDFYENI
jgi:uncharacterized DUF497 family protein